MTIDDLEATGDQFSVDGLLAVRERTRWAVHAIARQVEAGMTEEDAKTAARATLRSLGMRRGWHHIIVRVGSNTTIQLFGLVWAVLTSAVPVLP